MGGEALNPRWHLLLVLTLSLLVSLMTGMAAASAPGAVGGVQDLTGWDPQRDRAVRLDGQWEFYWHQLLEPPEIKRATKTGTIRVPGTWKGYLVGGEALSGDGYATFRLRVMLNDRSGLGLRVPFMSTAYRLWIDGEPVSFNGVVGRTRFEMAPQYRPTVVPLPPGGSQVEIIVQVSNFHHKRGGMWNSLFLGPLEQIERQRLTGLAWQIAMFGGLVVTALYHLGIYALQRDDRWLLYFGLFNLLFALRTTVMGEHPLTYLFPALDWELELKVEYMTLYLGAPLFTMFVHSLYPQEMSQRLVRMSSVAGAACALVALFTRARVSSELVQPFQLLTVLTLLGIMYALMVASIRNRPGARVFLVGIAALVLPAINDILYHNKLAPYGDLVPLGALDPDPGAVRRPVTQAFFVATPGDPGWPDGLVQLRVFPQPVG